MDVETQGTGTELARAPGGGLVQAGGHDLAVPLTAVFEQAACRWPDEPFLDSHSLPAESVTFGGFWACARDCARALLDRGVNPGDRVGLLSENRPRWCVAHAAILAAGGVVVPVDPEAGAAALAAILADAGASALFVSAGRAAVLDGLREAGWSGAVFGLDEDVAGTPWGELAAGGTRPLPELAGGDHPAAILYTSGTTGEPKGVILTHENLVAEVAAAAVGLEFRPDDVLLMFLPLHHVLSQVGSYLVPADRGLRVVHAHLRGAEDLLRAVREGGVSILLTVPLLLHLIHERITERLEKAPALVRLVGRMALGTCRLLRERVGVNAGRLLFRGVHARFGSRLRHVFTGGSALNLEVQRDLQAMGFHVMQAYGLTETSGGATFARPGDLGAVGTVGPPLPGVELRIADPDGEGVGEVLLRGRMITPGYHGRPEETAQVLRDGWLHTGDLGRLDVRGRLVLTGRSKDVIVLASGKNVHPEEIEAVLDRAPHVAESCVLARAGADRSERLHAVVVPDWDRLRRDGIGGVREAVRFELENASLELPAHSRPSGFELRREPLPRTATRKLKRYLVVPGQDEAAAATADPPDVSERLAGTVGRAVTAVLCRRVADATILGTSHLDLDLGLDSLQRMEVMLEVSDALGLALEDEDLARVATVDDLVRLALEAEAEGRRGAAASSWSALVQAAGPADLPEGLGERRRGLSAIVLRVALSFLRLAARVLFWLRVQGRDRVPPEGPFLACPNHVSFLDGFLVAAALPPTAVRHALAMGEADYVTHGLAGRVARFAGVAPIDPSRTLRRAMSCAAAALKDGRAVILFPEGTRSLDGTLQELKQGAAILAANLSVPIVPVAVEGAFAAWPRGAPWPRLRPCRVRFGEPIDPAPFGEDPEAAERLTAALRRALLELGVPPTGGPPDR